jgi:hypothetical protein
MLDERTIRPSTAAPAIRMLEDRQSFQLTFSARSIFVGMVALALSIMPVRAAEPLHAPLFSRAFSPDYIATADDALPGETPRQVKVFFRVTELGDLKIASGRVVVADPFVRMDNPPIATPIPNGSYPVRLAVLQGTMGNRRVAFARVDFSPAPVVRWEAVKSEDFYRDAENPGGSWNFEVDSGVAAFFDPEAGTAALKAAKGSEDFFDRWLEKGLNRGWKDGGASGAFRLLIDAGPANVAAFDAGWGDGVYMAYIGYDADGHAAALVADFDILDWSKVSE